MKKRTTWIQSGFYLSPRIWHHFPISRFELTVLQGLAYFANSDTGESWPSHDTLTALVGCDRRSLQRALRQLEACRAITAEVRAGKTTRYRLNEYAIVSDASESVITVALMEREGGGVGTAPQDSYEGERGGVETAPGAAYGPPGGGVGTAHINIMNEKRDKHHAAAISPRDNDEEELVGQLSLAGVDAVVARRLASQYPDRIPNQLRWIGHRKSLRSRAAGLVRAIEQNWAKPDGYREPVVYANLPDPDPDPELGSQEYEDIERRKAEVQRLISEGVPSLLAEWHVRNGVPYVGKAIGTQHRSNF